MARISRRRRRTPQDELTEQAAGLLVQAGRRYPVPTAIVLAVLLIFGGLWYLRQQRRAADQSQQTTTTTTTTTQYPAPPSFPTGASTGEVNLRLGNPSGATTDPANRANYLLVKPYYALSYNEPAGIPNWVSWRVARADLGDAPRKPEFDPDDQLPPGFRRIVHRDYSNSGFDRGHLCPNADRDATQASGWSTFMMTNIIPQAPNANQKAWANFEVYCRDLVRRDGRHLYVIAGPNGRGGRGSDGLWKQTIANGRVAVPAECWKVVVVVPEAIVSDVSAMFTPRTRVITVIMPNDNETVGEDWARFRTTPAEVERRTGYRFFDRLPPDVAEALRQKVDTVPVPVPESRQRRQQGR
jgi:endonuclease G, mitochondrial